jgi:hypothetical protein
LVYPLYRNFLKSEAVPQELRLKLLMCQAASQLSLTASAEMAALNGRLKSTAGFRERNTWLENAKFTTLVVKVPRYFLLYKVPLTIRANF